MPSPPQRPPRTPRTPPRPRRMRPRPRPAHSEAYFAAKAKHDEAVEVQKEAQAKYDSPTRQEEGGRGGRPRRAAAGLREGRGRSRGEGFPPRALAKPCPRRPTTPPGASPSPAWRPPRAQPKSPAARSASRGYSGARYSPFLAAASRPEPLRSGLFSRFAPPHRRTAQPERRQSVAKVSYQPRSRVSQRPALVSPAAWRRASRPGWTDPAPCSWRRSRESAGPPDP